jgi:hypothetical protein
MRIKPIHIILIITIPILLISFAPIKRNIQSYLAASRLRATIKEWNSLNFSPITNQIQRASVADKILNKLNIPQVSEDIGEEACSKEVLKATLVRLLTAFSTPDGVNFREMSGKPDFDNYRQFRGFDLPSSMQSWNTQKLDLAHHNPMLIRKLIPCAGSIPGNGQNETPEELHLLAWVSAIFDRPIETNRIPQATYCNGHWIGINVPQSIFCLTNASPSEFLLDQPNCQVGSYKSNFKINFPYESDRQLLFSTVVQLDCGFEAHPVAIALRWQSNARRWMPTAFAAGSSINGTRYLW